MGRRRLLAELCTGILMTVVIHIANAAPVNEYIWGDWTPWSPCSRSCGTELSMQERDCLSDTSCVGPRRQFRSCAAEACSETADFRARQCSTYDDDTHTYIPYEAGEDQCKLTCRASGSNGITSVIGPINVAPGASCVTAYGENGVCLDAICTPIGCDNILGSQKSTDRCLRCIEPTGHDQDCMRNAATVSIEELKYGHVQMLTLPAGASSISVTNLLQPVNASLMLRMPSGEFLFTVGRPGSTVSGGGTEFTYNVEASGDSYRETFTASGILTEDVNVEVYISDWAAPSISYEYYTLETNRGAQGGGDRPLLSIPSNISWIYGQFSECSESCITGTQAAYAVCRDLDFNRLLPDVYCPSPKPLPIFRQCGSGDCAPRWMTSEWQPCSQTECGIGSQYRVVQCHILGGDGVDDIVDDERCEAAEKPAEERDCVVRETSSCPVTWEAEEWGMCCTSAPLDRSIICQSADGTPKAPFLCSHLPRENSTKSCSRARSRPCENGGCDWVIKRWFSCNNKCGKGIQRRIITCRNANNRTAGNNCCKDKFRPEVTQECYDDRSARCTPYWHAGNFGNCLGECGEGLGVRTRTVECRAEWQEQYITFPDEFCVNSTRPAANESCTRTDTVCDSCHWVEGPWSECYCSVEFRMRAVNCSNGDDSCCFDVDPYKPTNGESCSCPSHSPPIPMPTTTPTNDGCPGDTEGVNCQQIQQDGLCAIDSTDYIRQLCCHTCSSNW